MSDLYIPLIDLPILLQEKRWAKRGNIEFAHRHMNWDLLRLRNSFLGIPKLKFLCSVCHCIVFIKNLKNLMNLEMLNPVQQQELYKIIFL